MIILVTGGTGFIGSNLCKELVKDKNNHVICLDNNFTGSLDNIRELRKLDNFELNIIQFLSKLELLNFSQ